MSSLARMLAVLGELAEHGPVMSADEIIARLGYSRGTGYRYLKVLVDHGFLYRSANGFSLGPRITELDYIIRQRDPILLAARPILARLSEETEAHAMLAQFFSGQVIVSELIEGTDNVSVSYGRGRSMPLFRGAASKVLIAALPALRRRRLYEAHAGEIAEAGLGESWNLFRKRMNEMHREPVISSVGELDRGNVGLSAPVALVDGADPLALTLVMTERRFAIVDRGKVERALLRASTQLSEALAPHA